MSRSTPGSPLLRDRFLSITLFVWEVGMGLGLQQGLFDQIPKGFVAFALVVPPLIFFSTRETMQRYTKRRPKMSLAIYLFVFLLAGYAAWFITFRAQSKRTQDSAGQNDKVITEELAEQNKRFDSVIEALTRNPNLDADAKLSIIEKEHDRLSKKRDKATTQEKETLDNQALTLKSLQDGRRRHLEAQELQNKQKELTSRREEIEQGERLKQLQKKNDAIEIEFAKQYAPAVDHAVATLYRMLRQISKESGEAFSTDIPDDGPSIYDSSNLLRDGKLVDGQQTIGVGSSKDWQFRIRLSGALKANLADQDRPRTLWLEIRAGLASVSMRSPYPVPSPPEPLSLHLQLWVDPRENYRRMGLEKPLKDEKCSLTHYQKPIESFLTELIRNRYNAAPLESKH